MVGDAHGRLIRLRVHFDLGRRCNGDRVDVVDKLPVVGGAHQVAQVHRRKLGEVFVQLDELEVFIEEHATIGELCLV